MDTQWVSEFEKIELDHSNELVTYLSWNSCIEKSQAYFIIEDEYRCQNFLKYVDDIDQENPIFVSNKCNVWKGATYNTNGYLRGKFNAGRSIDAHRFMYLVTYGIPKNDGVNHNLPCPCERGKSGTKYKDCCKPAVRHRCLELSGENHQGLCVNPLHLKLGTVRDNRQDIRVDKTGKGKVMKGEEHPNAKITDELARKIWEDIKGGMKLDDVANKHDVSLHIVRGMSASKTWTHITGKSNTKMLEQRKVKKDIKYFEKCQERKDAMESQGLKFFGEIPQKPEEPLKPTTKICRGILCKQLDPNGMELPLECFGWLDKEHIQRRSQCIQCKNEEQRKRRCNQEGREYNPKTPHQIQQQQEKKLKMNEIDTTQMKCCAGHFCKSKYPDGTPQPLENFPEVKGKPYTYCKTCKQEKDRQSYERRKKAALDEKQPINVTSIKLNCPVGSKYCKTCEDYLPIDRFPGSSTNTKRVQIIMDCTECRKMKAKKSKAESAKKIAEAKKRKAESTAPEQPEMKKSRNE